VSRNDDCFQRFKVAQGVGAGDDFVFTGMNSSVRL
jgi:hypothetical protein